MTFNQTELSILTWLNSPVDDFYLYWTLYWTAFNLTELSTW